MRTVRAALGLAAALCALVAACYDGDHLGFVPCQASEECDAPPRAQSRRACLHVAGDDALPGYCALSCDSVAACEGEAPGSATEEAVCAGMGAQSEGRCVLPCSGSQPCPSGMACFGYTKVECDDSAACGCFPIVSEAEGL